MKFTHADIRTLIHAETKRTGAPLHDEDLEQDAALNAVEAFRRIEHVTHPRALLRKIVQDTVRDHWRRRRPPCESIESVSAGTLAISPSFEFDLDYRRRIDLLREALALLPAPARHLLDLFYTRGESIAEIARGRGKSVPAVKMELVRTRRVLARIFRSLPNKKSR